MIADDQVDVHPVSGLGGGKGPYSGVDADDETDSLGGGALNDLVSQVVSLQQAVRHVKLALSAA